MATAAKSRAISRKAVAKMGRVLSPLVRAAAPRRAGVLKQAQGVKVGNSKRNKTGAFAVQGSRVKVRKVVTVKVGGRKGGAQTRDAQGRFLKREGKRMAGTRQVLAVPALYDHLVDQGTKAHSLGKGATLGRGKTRKKGSVAVAAAGQGSGPRHPGTKAVKFRERTWSANKRTVIASGQKVVGEEYQKVIAKESTRLLGKLRGK